MTSALDPSLRALARARFRARLARGLGQGLLVSLLAVGSAILLGRMLFGWSPTDASWAFLAVLLAPLWAFLTARRGAWGRERLAAWLDVSAGGDGSLVTQAEMADPRWEGQADAAVARVGDLPPAPWKGVAGRAAPASAFALAALFVPMPAGELQRPDLYRGTLADLEESLETLEEEIGLDEERAAELEERLEQLYEEAQAGRDPEATFEALDAFEQELERDAEQAAEALEQAIEELASSAGEGGESFEESMQSVMEQLAEGGLEPPAAEQLAAAELPPGLELPEGFEWPEAGEWSELGEQAESALSEAMRQELMERMQELADAGLLDDLAQRMAELAKLSEAQAGKAAEGELCEDCAKGEP